MTRAEYDAIASRVEREDVTPEINHMLANVWGWRFYTTRYEAGLFEAWRKNNAPPWKKYSPDFTNLQVVADHTPDGWVLLTLGEFTGRWECELVKGTTVVNASAPTEAAARVAAILRAKGAEAMTTDRDANLDRVKVRLIARMVDERDRRTHHVRELKAAHEASRT